MQTYVKIGGQEYEASVEGSVQDTRWNGRKSKSIRLRMGYAKAMELWKDDAPWSIITRWTAAGKQMEETYDNSDYCVAGPVTDNRDGTVTVKMGTVTAEELLAILTGEA